MAKNQKIQMPAGIRNKLMAAVCMLLVSSIMMMSTTYAWFTLSTAPEVTGITTSVGANGNLEMALLDATTYNDLSSISSAAGDSSAAPNRTVAQANITWGNLVDLSSGYGLEGVSLLPAALNATTAAGQLTVSTSNMLSTPVYGADGRVSETKANTIFGVYSDNKFVDKVSVTTTGEGGTETTALKDGYGVRAIGVNSDLTMAEIVLNAAKNAYRSARNGVTTPITSAVARNQLAFLNLAMSLNASDKTSYSAEELSALKDVATGVQSSLNSIVRAYSNAILAKLATTDIDEGTLTALQGVLSNNTSAAAIESALQENSVTADYSTDITALAAAQTSVTNVLAKLTGDGAYTTATPASDVKENVLTPLVGTTVTAYSAEGGTVSDIKNNVGSIKTMYVGGGSTKSLMETVADYAGTFKLTTELGIDVFAGAKDTAAKLDAVDAAVNNATIATSGSTAPSETKTLTDFYGYIIDFAFRTNAASSFLQLQTEAVNRVYSDGGSTVTQGAGSTVTFTYGQGLTAAQANTLLSAIKLVFLDPSNGAAYATANLIEIEPNDATNPTASTAKIVLDQQYVTKQAGEDPNNVAICSLVQNSPTRVSALVYLDGTKVDNTAVLATAASSGDLKLNLQFSSSATLVPMQNTALKMMELTYSEMTVGTTYTFEGKEYTLKEGYKLYKGNDGAVYFAQTAAEGGSTLTYTKLTRDNVTTALSAVAAPTTTYTVHFDLDGATGTMADVTGVSGTYQLPALDSGVTPPAGQSFKCWSVDNVEKSVGDEITVSADTTVKAIWQTTT